MPQFQYLADAGVHGDVLAKAKQQSINPTSLIDLINKILAVVANQGAAIINAIINLLSLFHILPGPSPTPAVPVEQARQKLLDAGVDKDLLQQCEAKGFDPAIIVAWITNIINAITVAGPALIQAILAILKLFPQLPPVTPPGPISPKPHGSGAQA